MGEAKCNQWVDFALVRETSLFLGLAGAECGRGVRAREERLISQYLRRSFEYFCAKTAPQV
jgi:hypothetical protein